MLIEFIVTKPPNFVNFIKYKYFMLIILQMHLNYTLNFKTIHFIVIIINFLIIIIKFAVKAINFNTNYLYIIIIHVKFKSYFINLYYQIK